MNTNDMSRLRSQIESTLCGLEAASDAALSELLESSEVNPNAFHDELDCAKAEVDLQTASEIHNHSVTQQICLRNALARMETGTFGICSGCGDEISLRRLEAMPSATHCVDCQSYRELGHAPEPSPAPNASRVQLRWAA